MRKIFIILLICALILGSVGVVGAEDTNNPSNTNPGDGNKNNSDGSIFTPTNNETNTPTPTETNTPTPTETNTPTPTETNTPTPTETNTPTPTETNTPTPTETNKNYKVSIEATPVKGVAPLSVAFKINTTIPSNERSKIEWEFGYDNKSRSSKESPSYTYEKSGTYTVTLSITTKTTGKKYTADPVKITVSDIDASFTASTTSGTAPLEVKFTDTSTGATAWTWNIYKTDGGSRTLQKELTDRNITYTFQNKGTYEVELIAKKDSNTATESKTITVTAKATTVPTTVKTTAPTTAATTVQAVKSASLSADDSPIPNPLDIIEELIRLLKVMLVPENYSLA